MQPALGPEDHDREMKEQELSAVMHRGSMWQGAEPAEAFLNLVSNLIHQKVKRSQKYQAVDNLILLLFEDSTIPLDWDNRQDKPILNKLSTLIRGAKPFDAVCILSGNISRSYAT